MERAKLTADEVAVLKTIYDWEYRPPVAIPNPELVKRFPGYEDRAPFSPLPLLVVKATLSKDKDVNVDIAIAALNRLGLIERGRPSWYVTRSWTLTDGRVLKIQSENDATISIDGVQMNDGRDTLVEVCAMEPYWSGAALFSEHTNDTFPCYVLTQAGLGEARKRFGLPPMKKVQGATRRGPRVSTDPAFDKKCWEAWDPKKFSTYLECANSLGVGERQFRAAFERHRKRLSRMQVPSSKK